MSNLLNKRCIGACVVVSLFIAFGGIGCNTPIACDPMATWQKPELLYLLPIPYDRLYVEVDTVEGTETPVEMLESLEFVLNTHFTKPRGIQIYRGKPISLSAAKRKPDWQIALENLDGPSRDADDERTAFLYVLFYDSKKLGREAQRAHAGAVYPCAIYFDVSSLQGVTRHYTRQVMVHELGHIMGLCKNVNHGDGIHCRNEYCAMSPAIAPMRTWLLGISPPNLCDTFCDKCIRDLDVTRSLSTNPKIYFQGPFYVRKEDGYYVRTLPFLINLTLEEPAHGNWRSNLNEMKSICRKYGQKVESGESLLISHIPDDFPRKKATLEKAATDPLGSVRWMAKGCLSRMTNTTSPPETITPHQRTGH